MSEPMELEILINDLTAILDSTDETKDYYLNRYIKIKNELHEMLDEIRSATYPRNYDALPVFHLIDKNADNDDIYEKVCEINNWYITNYRSKDEAVLIREMVADYLCNECGISENRAKSVIKGLGKHKEVYYEFASYVKNRQFSSDAFAVEGYTAEQLYNNYPLSVVGAYNYLIYLREDPQNAIADLKAGLPRK